MKSNTATTRYGPQIASIKSLNFISLPQVVNTALGRIRVWQMAAVSKSDHNREAKYKESGYQVCHLKLLLQLKFNQSVS